MVYGTGEPKADPAEQAAQLLFRIGFAILCILMPIIAVFSRRALVIVAPIGAIIMICGALLQRGRVRDVAALNAMVFSVCGLGGLFLLFWSALSLLWTPFPAEAGERLARVAAVLALSIGAVAALPDRMRVSNLYLLGFGVALAALAALANAFGHFFGDDPIIRERAVVLIALLAWPAVAWLTIKRRSLPAMLIAGGVGALALTLEGAEIVPALLVGGVLLGGAMTNLRGTAIAFAVAAAVLLLAAPAIALLFSLLSPQSGGFGGTMQIWADIILADPTRLLTGHGLETALRNRLSQSLDPSAPKSLLFEIWYELGALGAIAAATSLSAAVMGAMRFGRRLGPFALAGIGFALALAVTGLGTSQIWFITALGTAAIAFAAVIRGEYRTERPVAQAARRDR